MEIKDSKFITSATKKEQYPKENFPQIVLVGKSNIGKSSFINCITNRKNLAKTSSVPGKTRLINFYEVNGNLHLVDLPGYGYSQMSKKEEETSSKYINDFLTDNDNIKLVIFLVDIRHEPTKLDQVMFDWLIASKLNFVILANKADKIAKTKVPEYISEIAKSFKLREYGLENTIKILPFSSISKQGKDEILDIIEENI